MSTYKEIKGFKVQTLATDTAASAVAGGSWASAGANMNTARLILEAGGAGTQAAGLSIGVVHFTQILFTANTEEYNGTAWTELNDLNTSTRCIIWISFWNSNCGNVSGGATGGPGTPTSSKC